jgi:hypothetical protein
VSAGRKVAPHHLLNNHVSSQYGASAAYTSHIGIATVYTNRLVHIVPLRKLLGVPSRE